MRFNWTPLIIALAFNLVLLLGLALPTARGVSAECPAMYVVQPGDWLSRIALRYNTSLEELLRLNPGLAAHPNLIYAGQVLCVPSGATAPGRAPRDNQIVIDLTYQYTPKAAEKEWNMTRGGLIGTHAAYRLEPSLDALVTVSDTKQISTSVGGNLQPVLLGVRTARDSTEYILVAVDKPEILTSLAVSPTYASNLSIFQNRCSPQPLSILSDDPGAVITGTLSLQAGTGLRFPFRLAAVDYVTRAELASCYGPTVDNKYVGFALYPAGDGKPELYHTQIVLSKEGFGPPGYGAYSLCSGWYGGWYLSWLRAWYGC